MFTVSSRCLAQKHRLGITLTSITVLILFLNWLDYRYQGYAILNDQIISVQNFVGLSKVITLLNSTKVQSFRKNSSRFLLNKDIGHFKFWIKSGDVSMDVGLRFVDGEDIEHIQENYFKANQGTFNSN